MSDRPRHWMIELQRAYRAQPATFAIDEDGNECTSEIGWRRKRRDGEGPAKRAAKREATRTKRQRSIEMRIFQRRLAEFRARFADPSKIVAVDKTALITTPERERKAQRKQEKQQKQQKGGWKRRVSGLFAPGRDV